RHISSYRPMMMGDAESINLAVIAFYKWQRRELSKVLKTWERPKWAELASDRAFTVAAYQGREADIVILSMVRNNQRCDMGFLDRQQVNVGLSGGKRLLVVVGSFHMLQERAKSHRLEDLFVKDLVRVMRAHVLPAAQVVPEVLE